jgi:Holliday junction resolvasome RuvABC endonuclease subunit
LGVINAFLGIDPGKEGAIALLSADRTVLGTRKLDVAKSTKHKKEYDLARLVKVFDSIHTQYPNTLVCLEHLHAIPGLGALAGFMRGYSMGIIEMALTQLNWGYMRVTPSVWKPVMVGITGGDKDAAVLAAARLFPDDIWRFEKKRSGYDDNVAEAMLLAEYGRRKCL